MITKFKIFENNNEDSSQYIDKFYIRINEYSGYTYSTEMMSVILCTGVDFDYRKNNDSTIINPHGYVFKISKNNEITDFCLEGYSFTKDKFDKIVFITPNEFFNNYEKVCVNIYLKLQKYLDDNEISLNYINFFKYYKKVLEKIPDLKMYADSEKYNL